MTRSYKMTLGDLISMMHEEFTDLYGDADLASVAVSAVVNDLLAQESEAPAEQDLHLAA